MPNRKFIFEVFAALFIMSGQGNFCFSQNQRLAIHSEKSKIDFTVKHMGFLTVDGEFSRISGFFEFDGDRLIAVENRIPVASIDTSNKNRDGTLRDKPYLHAVKYPFIFFSSETITEDTITGRLKIKDVERNISFSYERKLVGKAGFQFLVAEVMIKRDDFDLDFGAMEALVGNEITAVLSIAIYKD